MLESVYNKKTRRFDVSEAAFVEIRTALEFTKKVHKRAIDQSKKYSKKRYSEIKLVCNELLSFVETSIENHEKRIKEKKCISHRLDYHKLKITFSRIARQQLKMSQYFAPRKNKRTSMKTTQSERLQAIFDADE